jgi:hypothetical protein
MIDVYVVREPLGSVIGLSIFSYTMALNDADLMCDIPRSVFHQLEKNFENNQGAEYRGYTLKKEKFSL